MFEFTIYDLHYITKFDDLGDVFKTPYDGVKWLTFNFAINETSIKVECFRSDVLIDDDDNLLNCTKVYLSDGSHVYAKNNYDTFKKNYYAYLVDKAKNTFTES